MGLTRVSFFFISQGRRLISLLFILLFRFHVCIWEGNPCFNVLVIPAGPIVGLASGLALNLEPDMFLPLPLGTPFAFAPYFLVSRFGLALLGTCVVCTLRASFSLPLTGVGSRYALQKTAFI